MRLPQSSESTSPALRPVPTTYEPGYPRALTQSEVADLLRPSLFRRFSRATLLTGAVLTGALAATFGAGTAAAADDQPNNAPKSTRTDPKLKARVDAVVAEVLGPVKDKGHWYASSALVAQPVLAANPPVKSPHIPISFGNSYCGVFDAKAARAATLKLFAEYGIALKADVPVRGDKYEFLADGYDPKTRTGFKIVLPQAGNPTPIVRPDGNPGVKDEEKDLDPQEQTALDADVKAGKLRMFVVQGSQFPNMDGDQYTPLRYYLASVVDYLNYINGDTQIDPTTVLGERPPRTGRQSPRELLLSQLADRAKEAVERKDYRQALGIVDQILQLEPEHEYAKAIRPLLADQANTQEARPRSR